MSNVDVANSKISDFVQYLGTIHDHEHFARHNDYAAQHASKRRHENNIDFEATYYRILDIILSAVQERFGDVDKLRFVQLIQASKFAEYKEAFPKQLIGNLKDIYPFFVAAKICV